MKFETTPSVVIRPIELFPSSVNHSAPSGPNGDLLRQLIPDPVYEVTVTGGDVPAAVSFEVHVSATTAIADKLNDRSENDNNQRRSTLQKRQRLLHTNRSM